MAKNPVTPAIRWLKAQQADYTEHPYEYEEHGGTAVSARELGVEEHQVVKTLMFSEGPKVVVMLMHGDCQVSARELARQAGLRSLEPCSREQAEKASGYQVGGISPFAQRKSWPTYAEASIRDLPYLYINGGKRGFLVGMSPATLESLLSPTWVTVKREK
jgi:Cys-tRNA(Pro) deacylase